MNNLSTFDERRLLVVDFDGVLVPAPAGDLRQFEQSLTAVRESLVLVYVSGRATFGSQVEDMNRLGLMVPDYVICALGTEIYRMPGEQSRQRMGSLH